MRLLLDSHALLWWLADDRRLKRPERDAIANGDAMVYVSAASPWEIAIKKSLGRIDLNEADLVDAISTDGFLELAIGWQHALMAGALPHHHDDPFDRMLIAQAQVEGLTLLSYDPAFRQYDVSVLP